MTNAQTPAMSTVAERLHEIAHRDSASKVTVSAEDLRQLLAEKSHSGVSAMQAQLDQAIHQMQQLGQTLGECIAKAGITNPEFSLSGPELLFFGEDLKTHIAQTQQGQDSFNAVITYVLANPCESPMEFLRAWNSGEYESLRKEWPDAPDEIYIGADTLHPNTVGYDNDRTQAGKPFEVLRLLHECKARLTDQLHPAGSIVAEIETFLLNHPIQANSEKPE
ncbi:hypothetical protein ACI77O_12530 [Pseudomonas tritici]|uniref:hypothetical protein n=1 Tax=Pseudomonas tritici TaxID=2745518 RepID=UPI00387B7B70